MGESNERTSGIRWNNVVDKRRHCVHGEVCGRQDRSKTMDRKKVKASLKKQGGRRTFRDTDLTLFFVHLHPPQLSRDFEMRLQLAHRDRDGMTAAMLAARSGSVSIVAALITEIEETEVKSSYLAPVTSKNAKFCSRTTVRLVRSGQSQKTNAGRGYICAHKVLVLVLY